MVVVNCPHTLSPGEIAAIVVGSAVGQSLPILSGPIAVLISVFALRRRPLVSHLLCYQEEDWCSKEEPQSMQP